MKKLWAFLLAFAMVAAMGAPALAEDTTDTSTATNNGKTDTSIAVNGQHTPTITPEVISADIAWDPMDFTYNKAGQMWDPATHKFIENTESGWVWTYKKEGQNSPYITITNHSNINLTAEPKFEAAEGLNIISSFSNTNSTFYLRSAEDTTLENPPFDYAPFSINSSSDPITESKDIGTITVTIQKGETTEVANEKALKNINLTTPSVVLNNDITLTRQLKSGLFSGVIDLAGHTLTSNDNSDEGSIYFTGGKSYSKKGYPITIKNGTITGSAKRLLRFGQDSNGAVDVTMKNCTINTEATDGSNDFAIWVDGATLRLQDCTINSKGAVGLNIAENEKGYGGVGKVILSGDIKINAPSAYTLGYGCTVTCLAGTYNFDPSGGVDQEAYNVTKDETTGIWTVTAK